ncbi:hypothetical protein CryarDRAFT_3296 [Cryptosporangium arvum DSM 44712]|uniref:Uncharacterized protein n=1 Tax=Cryptosporangium arvum DSM 44712 TaxID=927661 RepID=A0A010ZTX9_9ACTN|nr:hypothetical protein CryarDRAFT_3296 [Cryptosporangium arvum DSM 44712]
MGLLGGPIVPDSRPAPEMFRRGEDAVLRCRSAGRPQ